MKVVNEWDKALREAMNLLSLNAIKSEASWCVRAQHPGSSCILKSPYSFGVSNHVTLLVTDSSAIDLESQRGEL